MFGRKHIISEQEHITYAQKHIIPKQKQTTFEQKRITFKQTHIIAKQKLVREHGPNHSLRKIWVFATSGLGKVARSL